MMASAWFLRQLRQTITALLARQHEKDQCPGTAEDQQADSDATFFEASLVHRALEDHASEIEHRLEDIVIVRGRKVAS